MIPLPASMPARVCGTPRRHCPLCSTVPRVGLSTDLTPEGEPRSSRPPVSERCEASPVESPPGDGRFEVVFAAAIQTELLKCAGSVDGDTGLLTSRCCHRSSKGFQHSDGCCQPGVRRHGAQVPLRIRIVRSRNLEWPEVVLSFSLQPRPVLTFRLHGLCRVSYSIRQTARSGKEPGKEPQYVEGIEGKRLKGQ